MEVTTLAALAAVVSAGAGLQRVSGMGLALVAAPVFVILLDPLRGVFLVNYCSVVLAARLTLHPSAAIDRRRGRSLVLTALLGVAVGSVLLLVVPTSWLHIVVGASTLLALLSIRHDRTRISLDRSAPLATAGVLSGLANVATGMGGPPLAAYRSLTGWGQRSFAATVQPVFLATGVISLATKLWLVPAAVPALDPWIWVAFAIACLTGAEFGDRLAPILSERVAGRMLILLAVGGGTVVLARGAVLLVQG